jgi:hypothetical protein
MLLKKSPMIFVSPLPFSSERFRVCFCLDFSFRLLAPAGRGATDAQVTHVAGKFSHGGQI